MGKFTYEQFARQCERWNMTIEEGYRAMCFTFNIIGEHVDNCMKLHNMVVNTPYNSEVIKAMAENQLSNAQNLLGLYLELDQEVFDVLESYADAHESTE